MSAIQTDFPSRDEELDVQLRYGPDLTYLTVCAIWRKEKALDAARKRVEQLEQLISRPYIGAWTDEVIIEAAHQRERWGIEHDAGKEAEDWFWLVGYLAGKALRAAIDGDEDKARHHTVSTAAVLANWAAAIKGYDTVFCPGLGPERIGAKPAEPAGE